MRDGDRAPHDAKALLVRSCVVAVAMVQAAAVIAGASRAESPGPVAPPATDAALASAARWLGGFEPERPDDPPAPRAIRRAAPRAPASPIVRAPFVSVQVNVDALGNDLAGDAANEPSLAVDPLDPSRMVIGWRQFDSIGSNFREAGWAYSSDGGATWTPGGVLEPDVFRSDPVLAADPFGNFYYASLTALVDCMDGSCPTSLALGVDVFKSSDGGVSFPEKIAAFGGDKQWLAAGSAGDPADVPLYMAWTSLYTCTAPPGPTACPANSDFTRSDDAGASFHLPESRPGVAGIFEAIGRPLWGNLTVAPDGAVVMLGANSASIADFIGEQSSPFHVFYRSPGVDPLGLSIFEGPISVDFGGVTEFARGPNPGGMLGQVWGLADPGSTTYAGNLYGLASVDPPGPDPLDLMFVRSEDAGESWSQPIRVNDDALGSRAWQWFGTGSVAPDGRIDAVWNDTRDDTGGLRSELRYAYSRDGGTTWSASAPVTPSWDPLIGFPNQEKIGDYYHMTSTERDAAVTYAATFRGGQDVYFVRAGDCNGNGRHDGTDIEEDPEADCNANGVLDACEETSACRSCSSDAECSDDLFCNGDETCSASGACQAGALVCGARACDESRNSCIEPLQVEVRGTVKFVCSSHPGGCGDPAEVPVGVGEPIRAVFEIDPSTPDSWATVPGQGWFHGAVIGGWVELGAERLDGLGGRWAYVTTETSEAGGSLEVFVQWQAGDAPPFSGPTLGTEALTYADVSLRSGRLDASVLPSDTLALPPFQIAEAQGLYVSFSTEPLVGSRYQLPQMSVLAEQVSVSVPDPELELSVLVSALALCSVAALRVR